MRKQSKAVKRERSGIFPHQTDKKSCKYNDIYLKWSHLKCCSTCNMNFEVIQSTIFSATKSSGLIDPTSDNHYPADSFRLPFKGTSTSAHCTTLQLLRQPVCEASRNCVCSPYTFCFQSNPIK